MSRNRLTTRVAALKARKAESQKDGLFPGDVGNEEREKNYHDMDEYNTFEQTVNHELPDMRHEWKDNPREETGHGIPKIAKVYMAAKKATKLAMMLLGEEAPEKMIEEQARDFMRMGGNALTASINRWAEMEELATPEEDEVKEGCNCTACNCVAEDEVAPEAPVACDGEKTAPVAEEDVEMANEEEMPVANDEDLVVGEGEEEVIAEDETVEAEDEEVVAEDEEDVEVDEGLISTDIEFDDAEDAETDADPELEKIFDAEEGDDNEVAPVEEAPVARKAGIKTLAAQPKLVRVASKKAADELAGIWSKWESPTL